MTDLTDPEHVERLAGELLAAHPYQHHPDNVQANLAAHVNLLTIKEAAATLRALSAKLQEPVEVKPLEWDGLSSGPYEIQIEDGGTASLINYAKRDGDGCFETLRSGYLTLISVDDFKKIAERHNRSRVRAMLADREE